jgi:hypothetical protein
MAENSAIKWFRWLLVFNIIDAFLTTFIVGVGLAYEYNPLIRRLMEWNPLAFLTIKTAIVAIAYYEYRDTHRMGFIDKSITVMYGLLILFQVTYIGWILWN